MRDFLRDYQRKAVSNMRNGCILNGGVGSGKSTTGLYYYFKEQGGEITDDNYVKMKNPVDLYIITTARKRDTGEWEGELSRYSISTSKEDSAYDNNIVIDSWNNIKKYEDVSNAFFIFDEDKVTGYGVWAKTFLKIAKKNDWIVLSATSGDRWEDYMTIFIANGFYKNKTDFINQHIEYDRFCTKFPKVKAYHNTGRLIRLRRRVLVNMDFDRPTTRHNLDIYCGYNREAYKELFKTRWDFEKNEPIENASALCYKARKIVNSDVDRISKFLDIVQTNWKSIVFYNFDYELDILRTVLEESGIPYAEWNGHMHQPIPTEDWRWCYLVQYTAGAEGWNCILTDTIIFYSQNYSYKMMEQAAGRIDRMNTPYRDLYYYHLKSRSPIDISISKSISEKKKFNESKFVDSL